MEILLNQIRTCTICQLENGHRPVVQASKKSKILLIGQAPGRKVHETGIPWDDPSGRNLKKWLGVTEEQFYNPDIFALVPMGFCYPGHSPKSPSGKSADLPPRTECAPKWHEPLLAEMSNIHITLLFGQYVQKRYLGNRMRPTLTETVKNFKEYLLEMLAMPHPSPRNDLWLRNWCYAKVRNLSPIGHHI